MKRLLVCCGLVIGVSGSAMVVADDKPAANKSAAEKKADPRESLDTAIAEGIRLLEAKEYEGFIKTFAVPEELKSITSKVPMEQLVEGFKSKGEHALSDLKVIKALKPEVSADGKTATYKADGEKGPKRTLVFTKIDKLWYVKN